MYYNMKQWVREYIADPNKKAIPVLSFPAVQLLNVTIRELLQDSDLQAQGMIEIAKRCPSGAVVSYMDLSVEAEAFGAGVEMLDNEVPRIIGNVVGSIDDAQNLPIPSVGAARTGICIDAVSKVSQMIDDRPVFAGTIGPFSLAGRLMGMNKLISSCRRNPDMVMLLAEKATVFLLEYIKAFKAAGANGVVIAEPAAGLLSPKMMKQFSCTFCRKIVDEVQDENFIVIYHNCGASTTSAVAEIVEIGAAGVHLGDAVPIEEMIGQFPDTMLVMGNVSPSNCFLNGTTAYMEETTRNLLSECSGFANFVISSGCDIPYAAPWENIDRFFDTVECFNRRSE